MTTPSGIETRSAIQAMLPLIDLLKEFHVKLGDALKEIETKTDWARPNPGQPPESPQ